MTGLFLRPGHRTGRIACDCETTENVPAGSLHPDQAYAERCTACRRIVCYERNYSDGYPVRSVKS